MGSISALIYTSELILCSIIPCKESLSSFLHSIVICCPNTWPLDPVALSQERRLAFIFRQEEKHAGQSLLSLEQFSKVEWLYQEWVLNQCNNCSGGSLCLYVM